MENKKVKYLIIGAGISGLTFANYVDDYLIIEKEGEVGGYCRTIRKKNYIWDYAGHFFHFKSDEFKNLFLNSIDKNKIINKEKCTKIIYKNKLIDYPFQTNIHQLNKKEFIDCLYDLFNKTEKEDYDNFLDMLYGKFGESTVEKFLKPYNEKLYACDLKTLDKNSMGRFFPYANSREIINNMKKSHDVSYNSKFLYSKDGADSFIKILQNKLNKERIKLNTEITSVDIENKIAFTSDNNSIKYDYLINTSPLNQFLKIINNEKYFNLEKKLSYNKVLVFNLGFDKKSKFINEHWIYIPDKKVNFYRIGFYDNILDSNKLSLYIEIGYSKNAIINVDEQLKETLINLEKLKIIDKTTKLEEYVSIIMDPAYVHINSETEKQIQDIFNEFEKNNIYSIGRYGSWTYCSMEDCMISAKKLTEKV